MKKTINYLIFLILLVFFAILLNFSGRYIGIKEYESFLDDRCEIVLKASDICIAKNMTFYVYNDSGKINGGCINETNKIYTILK